MRTLLLFAVMLFVSPQNLPAQDTLSPELHGIWFCTTVNGYPSYRAKRTVLMMRGNEFLLVTGTGISKSTASTNKSHIEIIRDDGKSQRGIFRVDNSSLWITLADPNGPRPDHMGHKKGAIQRLNPPHSHYHFQRSPTVEGLAILRSALNDEAKLAVIESLETVALDQ